MQGKKVMRITIFADRWQTARCGGTTEFFIRQKSLFYRFKVFIRPEFGSSVHVINTFSTIVNRK
jgi:hypothetical protein